MSGVVRAPHRFSLVGLHWRGHSEAHASLRVRRAGGRWTRWVRYRDSSPVWVGRADWAQYRLSRRMRGVRVHFVSVSGDRARPRAQRAQAGQPPIEPRSAWDPSNQCPPRTAPQYGDVQVAFVHHTVSLNDYQPSDVPSIILGICRFHRNSNGWNDIGYNFIVDKFGTLWEGRAGGIDQPVVGAQAQGYNSQSTGIANIGTFDNVPETDAALNAMAQLIRWKLPLTGAPTSGTTTLISAGGESNRYPAGTPVTLNRISGHRDVDSTDCPGGILYTQLSTLRQLVGTVGPTRARTKLSTTLVPSTVDYGSTTTVSGSLALINAAPLSGPVQVQLFGHGAWHTVASGSSATDGSFGIPLKPSVGHMLRVIYPGDGSHLPSTSHKVVLKVRPRISLRRSVARAAVGRTPMISGTIRPAKTRLRLVITRKSGGRKTRVASFKLRAKSGRFRKSYRLPGPGLYTYQVRFDGDRSNVRTASAKVHVRAR
jgi:N-acetylmuramoyl-L-alanine amidase